MERPDAGSDSFEEKLRRQLEPAPPEAKRLWAEITWLYYLIVKPVKRVNKLDRIKTAWEWSEQRCPRITGAGRRSGRRYDQDGHGIHGAPVA